MENLISIDGEVNPELEILIGQFKRKEIHLSASKLKSLESPLNFTRNLVEKKTSVSMVFGSVVDALITEADTFDEKYIISDETLSAGNQEDVYSIVQADKSERNIEDKVTEAYKQVYKTNSQATIDKLINYCRIAESGKKQISQEVHDRATVVANNLKTDERIAKVLEEAHGMQYKLDFNYRGWRFIGYMDILSGGNIYDLKFASQLNPDRMHLDVQKWGYEIQSAIYALGCIELGLSVNPKYFFIFFDDKGNYTVPELAYDYMVYAQKKLDVYINRLERIIRENAWFKSYDFFNKHNSIHKPGWLKGFSYEDLEGLDYEED